jgi:hypothetical protein
MEAVDVLREHHDARDLLLEHRDDLVAAVRRRRAAGELDVVDVLPDDLGMARHHLAREQRFDGQPALVVALVVEPADAAIRRQPRIGGEPGAGDEERALRLRQKLRDTFDQFLVDGVAALDGAAAHQCEDTANQSAP